MMFQDSRWMERFICKGKVGGRRKVVSPRGECGNLSPFCTQASWRDASCPIRAALGNAARLLATLRPSDVQAHTEPGGPVPVPPIAGGLDPGPDSDVRGLRRRVRVLRFRAGVLPVSWFRSRAEALRRLPAQAQGAAYAQANAWRPPEDRPHALRRGEPPKTRPARSHGLTRPAAPPTRRALRVSSTRPCAPSAGSTPSCPSCRTGCAPSTASPV